MSKICPTPWKNGRHLADEIIKWIVVNENGYIVITIALKFVPRGPVDIKKALLQVIAWRRTDDKPLPELLLTQFTEAYIYAAPGGDGWLI